MAHRESLENERTDKIARLRWLVHDLDPDLAPPLRTLGRFKVLDRLARELEVIEQTTAVAICLDLLARCREITVRANELEHQITQLVAVHSAALTEIPGCGSSRRRRSSPRPHTWTGSPPNGISCLTRVVFKTMTSMTPPADRSTAVAA